MNKQKNDATASIRGLIYQFLIAVEKCLNMHEGDTVYIETFGDISVIGKDRSEQVESKFYKKKLSDVDLNIWNTLNNWLDEEFPLETFSSLVLITTQNVTQNSSWYGWNDKDSKTKLLILNDIAKNYFNRRSNKSAKTSDIINSVMDPLKAKRLNIILSKFVIDNNARNDVEYLRSLREIYAKHISPKRQNEYINSILGYIISPNSINSNNWSITYESFAKEVSIISQSFIETTTIFPAKIRRSDIKPNEYRENIFVNKIREIKYEDAISDAISDYIYTKTMLLQEILSSKTMREHLNEYEDDLKTRHSIGYRKAVRSCILEEHKISRSQDFYDEMMIAESGTFHAFNYIPKYFHNGMLHILAEENEEFIWLLKLKA